MLAGKPGSKFESRLQMKWSIHGSQPSPKFDPYSNMAYLCLSLYHKLHFDDILMIPWWRHCTNLYQFWALNSLTHHIRGRLCKESVARMDPSIGHLEDQPCAWPSLAVQGKDGYWMATGSWCLLLCLRGCFWGEGLFRCPCFGEASKTTTWTPKHEIWMGMLETRPSFNCCCLFSFACGVFLWQGLQRRVIMPGCLTIAVSRGSQSRSGLWSEALRSFEVMQFPQE